jgi:hypothetical protein
MFIIRKPLPALLMICVLIAFSLGYAEETTSAEATPKPNTPDIPEPTLPGTELPRTSEFLTVERVPLSNFSPELADSSPVLEKLGENALCLDFRLAPGNCHLWVDGNPSPPTTLELRYNLQKVWRKGTPGRATPNFDYLGAFEGSHYYLSTTKASWPIADLNCRLAGGDLATINSASENAFVYDAVRAWMNPMEHVLIGLTDWGRSSNDWAWRSGEPVRYANWRPGEPNNYHGEYFGMIVANDGRWNDVSQQHAYHYVMETDHEMAEPTTESVPAIVFGEGTLYLGGLTDITEQPYLERQVYWSKVFHVTVGANATYNQMHSYTHGTSETTGRSFGYSIGISAEAGWGPFTAKIESEFHQDFKREMTVEEESTFEKNYMCTSPNGQIIDFALWQLRERFVIRTVDGAEWSDPNYVLSGRLPYLDQGLEQEFLQTVVFDQDR